jgi:cytochrome c biogenesis protein CcdA
MKKTKLLLLAFIIVLTGLFSTTVINGETRQAVYFTEKGCLVCAELGGYLNGPGRDYTEDEDYIKKMVDQGITVTIYDLESHDYITEYSYEDDEGNTVNVTALDIYDAFNESYERGIKGAPVVFVGDTYFEGLEDIQNAVNQNTIFDLSDDPLLDISVEEGQAYQNLEGIVGFFLVVGAGLLDGFNPCAIALLLLFVSLLGFSEKKRVLILVSIVYIFALFISYFLIGTLFLSVLEKYAAAFASILVFINWFIALLCLLLFTLNIYDFFQIRKANYGKIKSQLPKFIQRFNKKIVKTFTNSINSEENNRGLISILLLTFILGILLSVTELLCTGGIYLPILYGIHTIQSSYAYILLLIYNLMFVVPLIIIAVVAVRLKSVMSVSNYIREHMSLIKLLNSMLFLGIAVFFFTKIF